MPPAKQRYCVNCDAKLMPGNNRCLCPACKTGNRKHRMPERDAPGLRPEDDSPQAEEPTYADPGSNEKILVMRARAESGLSPFHEDDLVARPHVTNGPKVYRVLPGYEHETRD